jgi:hypothetical protein
MNTRPVSLRLALDRPALPVRPRRARCLVRPNWTYGRETATRPNEELHDSVEFPFSRLILAVCHKNYPRCGL